MAFCAEALRVAEVMGQYATSGKGKMLLIVLWCIMCVTLSIIAAIGQHIILAALTMANALLYSAAAKWSTAAILPRLALAMALIVDVIITVCHIMLDDPWAILALNKYPVAIILALISVAELVHSTLKGCRADYDQFTFTGLDLALLSAILAFKVILAV